MYDGSGANLPTVTYAFLQKCYNILIITEISGIVVDAEYIFMLLP